MLLNRFFVDDVLADRITFGDAVAQIDLELAATGYPAQSFLQQALAHITHRFVGLASPAHRAAFQRVDDAVIAFFTHIRYLIAELAEDVRHRWHTDLQLGAQRQHLEGQITHTRQRTEPAQRIREQRPPDPQRQTTSTARPVHFFQRHTQAP